MNEDPVELMNEWCEFGEDRVYFLMALARPKENEELTDNSKPAIRKVIAEEDEIERKYEELVHAVKRFDVTFRIYLSVNARNTVKTFFNYRQRMENWSKNVFMGDKDEDRMKHFKNMDSEWKSELQRPQNKDETFFVFDVDDESESALMDMKKTIQRYKAADIKRVVETPNGYHIITTPFDHTQIDCDWIDWELKTDGMTCLEMV